MTASHESLLAEVEALRRVEPARALARLDADFAAAARRATPAARGLLWRTRGHILRSLRRTREAVGAYGHAERWYAAAGDGHEQGRCAIGLFDSLLYLGRYRDARRTLARGRRLLAGDRAALARLMNSEGNLWHRLDLPERALSCYREAVRALERSGDKNSAAMIGTNVGNCLSLLGRCEEARTHYARARRAHRAAGALNEALSAEYNLAYLDFLEHRDEAALTGLARVRDEAAERGYPSLAALARLDRAEILLRMGAHDDALAEAVSAIEACAALGLRYETAKAEVFAALARHRLGQAAAARAGLERSLEAFDAEGNEVWTGEALIGLGTMWARDGNPRAAAALLSAARRRFASANDHEREACAATLEARARLTAGRRGEARRLLALARRRARRRSPRFAHLWLAAAAALARADGDRATARRMLRRAAAESERLAARILDEQWRSTFWGEWGWPHLELATLELDDGDVAAAFESLEAGRGRALLGTYRSRSTRGGPLPRSVRRWAASRQARERSSRAGGLPAAAESLQPAVRRALDSRVPHAVRVGAVRRSLSPGTRLIDFLVHDGELAAIVLDADRLVAHRSLVSEPRLNSLVQAVLFSLRSAAYAPEASRVVDPALEQDLAELAALALWPVSGGRAPDAFAIAPVGPLARIPWAALPMPDGRPLCEAHTMVLVPGLRLGLAHARPGRASSGRPLVIAVDAGELAAVGPETRSILAAFPDAQVLAGDDATAERVLALAPEAPWIHFAGHGGFRADAPHESGLRLADRWLLAGEIAELTLAARWVTLSACHTARALVRPGEEWIGLARAFLLAGAGAVVAAQWDVEDGPTAALMGDLYGRLGRGESLAPALAGAQSGRRAAGAHPLDWAGFVVLGGPSVLEAPMPGVRGGSPKVVRPDRQIPHSGSVVSHRKTAESIPAPESSNVLAMRDPARVTALP